MRHNHWCVKYRLITEITKNNSLPTFPMGKLRKFPTLGANLLVRNRFCWGWESDGRSASTAQAALQSDPHANMLGMTWDAKAALAVAMRWGRGEDVQEEPTRRAAASPSADGGADAGGDADAVAKLNTPASEVGSMTGSTSSPTEAEESDGMDHEPPPPPPSVMRKKRKPTYYVRKDEMSRLREEIEALQEKLRDEEAKRQQADEALSKQLVMNAALASDVKQNEMVVSGMRAMICARNALRDRNPLETDIRLTTSEDERRQTLLALKEQKIFEGKEFIDEYCKRVVNPTRAMKDCQTYETQKGDFVLDQFDLNPFENATSVKQAYDALLGFFSAQEVSITAMYGVLSVRETDDCGESTASQCRIVTTFQSGVQVESNAIMYLRYCDRDEHGIELEEPYGLVTIDFVNQDDQFPYQPASRVREDITMVGLIRSFKNPLFEMTPPEQRAGIHENIVAMARWGFTRIHEAQCPIPFGADQELRDTIRHFSDAMPLVMNEIITTRRFTTSYFK